MDRALAAALHEALGSSVVEASGVTGGDINQAFDVRLEDGRRVFVKSNARPPRGLFAAEAEGLAWLAEAKALRIPDVLASSDAPGAAFLALAWIEPGRRARDFDEQLGHGLARLHRTGAPAFGHGCANFIGPLPQDNRPLASGEAAVSPGSWPAFFRARRLEPMLRRAVNGGGLSQRARRGFDALFARLDDLCGPAEPPARLHGDLWGGNLLVDAAGAPCLIDPAVYAGHREVDLAMMRLFGGFSPGVYAAYDEAFPLAAGHEERVALYQLYPLLVHAMLFGGGYGAQVEAHLARLV